MTNFEKWKDEILKIANTNSALSLVEGKLAYCDNTICVDCEFCNDKDCGAETIKWLYSEYTEPKPKLTKRERAFCEAVCDMVDVVRRFYIGRTSVGNLYIGLDGYPKFSLDNSAFKFIKFDESWFVCDLLKLEVEA